MPCNNPENRLDRKESERLQSYTYEELLKRDKANWISSGSATKA